MAGLEGRTQLLIRLADALDGNKDFFGEGRPGHMLGECSTLGREPHDSNRNADIFAQTTSCPTPPRKLPRCLSFRYRPCGMS